MGAPALDDPVAELDVLRRAASKVPQITVLFWIIKVMTTAQGEAVSDFLAVRYGPVIAVSLGATGLAIALALQFRARRYVAWIYWTAVVMVAVFGTMAADGLHVELGVPYDVSTPFFAISLAVISRSGTRPRRRCPSTALTPLAGSSSTGPR
jgi:uncharacterized membrane-anchored protein